MLAGVGFAFTFAKIVSVVKAFLFAEQLAAPVLKKALVNDRAAYWRLHVNENHQDKPAYCMKDACANLT